MSTREQIIAVNALYLQEERTLLTNAKGKVVPVVQAGRWNLFHGSILLGGGTNLDHSRAYLSRPHMVPLRRI